MPDTFFELAPLSRRYNWDKALAISLTPSAPAAVAIWFVTNQNLPVTVIVTTVCFIGTLLVALTLGLTQVGRLTLTPETLRLRSGFLENSVLLADLDLAAARRADDPTANPRLVTRPDHAITIPRRTGPPVVVTPLEPDQFLKVLHRLQ